MTVHYFAEDGNYGDAENIIIIHTDGFTEEDWAEIEEATDSQRADVAQRVAQRKTIRQLRGL